MIPNVNVNFPDTTSFTVTAWLQPKATGIRYFVARGRDGLGSGWSVRLGTNNNVPYAYIVHTGGGTAAKAATATSSIDNLGAWVTYIYDQGVGLKIFVNGKQEAETNFTNTTLRASTRGWYLGGPTTSDSQASSESAFGLVGDVFLWSRVLTPEEIRRNGGAPYWVFNKRQIFVPSSVSAPSLPTLTAITPDMITSTGARLTITAS
jgi:hypothetical protein